MPVYSKCSPAGTPSSGTLRLDWPEADIAISRDPIDRPDRENGRLRARPDRRSAHGSSRCDSLGLEGHGRWRGDDGRSGARSGGSAASRSICVAAVGPSIGPCCYEVGSDPASHFAAHPDAPRWFSHDTKPRLDLWRATRDQLERAGIPTRQLALRQLCTVDHPALFHSYRRDGKAAGRLVAAIRSGPGKKL